MKQNNSLELLNLLFKHVSINVTEKTPTKPLHSFCLFVAFFFANHFAQGLNRKTWVPAARPWQHQVTGNAEYMATPSDWQGPPMAIDDHQWLRIWSPSNHHELLFVFVCVCCFCFLGVGAMVFNYSKIANLGLRMDCNIF